MISYLKGKVVLFKFGFMILETGGVGYKVFVSPQIKVDNNVVNTGESVELFIHEQIREDADDLYGFLTFQELELFEKIISVSGVGPKVGLNIMSSAKPEQIISAINSDNLGFFVAIPGIGKKVAAKIILDLKSKLSGGNEINILNNDSDGIVSALESLGYKAAEIGSVVPKIPAEIMSDEARIRWCLKNLA